MKIDGLTGEPRRVFRRARKLRVLRYALILGVAGALLINVPTAFSGVCLIKRDTMGLTLKSAGQVPVNKGRAADGTTVETFVSAGGRWSTVHTTTSGHSCVIASGDGWKQQPVIAALVGGQLQ